MPPAPDEADFRFRQAEFDLRIVRRDAIVTRQRDFQTAAEREAFERARHRFAAGLQGAQPRIEAEALLELRFEFFLSAFRLGFAAALIEFAKIGSRRRSLTLCRT